MMVGLINTTSAGAGVSSRLRIATATTGQWDYARIINNTAFSTDVNITGLNGSISMYSATAGAAVNGWYEIGYYNPNGTANNFVGLFNSTAATTTTATQTSFPISFNNKWGIIPAGNKSAVRVWMNATASSRPGFWSYGTAANQDSSINVTIATPLGAGAATYNISGYVTNNTNGATLSGATVQTNTSLTTTTNASGGYNFTGLSNGTYIINASLIGYATNSTNVTVSGANVTNANISLTPVPTYLLSGYVTNASNGQAIIGATVTTNTSLTTTTNATGYYNFTLSNGTYLITASKTGYSDNSTTRTVSGAAVGNVNIMLTPTPPVSPVSGKILVATNRFVVLDDPDNTSAKVGSGFGYPQRTDAMNSWTGILTTINATALYIDNNGFPIGGSNVTFKLFWPNGTELTQARKVNQSTDLKGLANFSADLNQKNYYGRWTIRAEIGSNSSIGANYSFIYNWWGCGFANGGCGDGTTHYGGTPSTTGVTIKNSPYMNGWDQVTTRGEHTTPHTAFSTNQSACTHCHQSFDNNSGGSYTAIFWNSTADVHRNVANGCANSSCHGDYITHGQSPATTSNQLVASCYNATGGCHVSRSDISNKSTLNSTNIQYALSLYSYANGTIFNASFHTPNSTVPCIICHGPMHNITKPDESQRFIKNTNTEDTQCKTCHTSYTEHNSSNITSGGVNCTLCHSDDVHDIQVFAQNTTYVDLNHNNPNPARGNCTNCHQNATFFAALEKKPKAGNYTGRDPPIIPVPLNHSINPYSGALWNQTGYWDNKSQYSACNYCHGTDESLHTSSALGKINNVKGSNILNQSLTNSTWCANCHYKNALDYNGDQFIPQPPEILNLSALVPATAGDGTTKFYNHTGQLSNYNDTACKSCHNNNLGASATSLNFSHNLGIGSAGGVNCTECHDMGGSVNNVNFTTVGTGIHANLNRNASSSAQNAINRPCWACHGTKNGTWANESDQPTGHNNSFYKNPRTCRDCHITGSLQFNADNVTDHIPSGSSLTDLNTSSYNYTSCSYCHNNSVYNGYDLDMGLSAGGNPINASVSHYGANKTGGKLMSATNNSTDCVYCHRNTTNMVKWGIKQSSPANISNKNGTAGTRTNHSDYTTSDKCKYCHGSYIVTASLTFHDAPLGNGSFGPDCKSCHDIGGIATGKLVNFSAMNSTDAIHKNLNSLASATVDVENKKCWACHTANGTQPLESSNHSVVNRYTNPYNCTDCHIQGAGQNFNYTPNTTLLNVTQHYWNGNKIATLNADTCYDCHNKTVMMITAYDPDSGTGNVYGGTNGGNNSTSHYGRKRADMVAQQNTTQYCYNCHNGSSVFPFIDNANRTISNHTGLATNPGCVNDNCHNGGRIHDSNLTKPAVNTTLCNYCHTSQTRHNNSVECKECHLETNRSIHPVQYLQPDNTWKINSAANKTSAVNCTNCHQAVLSSNFSNAPIIPATLKHSSALNNGSIWNTTPYWNNEQGSCYYCHNDTIHNSTALGRISDILSPSDSNNTRNGAITTTTWCIDCHLNAGNTKYKGNLWSPNPPLITVNNTLKSTWEDHSTYLGSGIKDKNCESCHAQNITAAEASLNYSHSLNEGVAGGPNCIQCHNLVTGLSGGAPSGINFTAFNLSIHFGINSVNSTTNGACWACHDSDGNVTSGHGDRQKTPKRCDECHLSSGTYYQQSLDWGLLVTVSKHYYGASGIKAGNSSSNIGSCINCHENVSEMIVYNNDTDTGSFTGDGIRQNGGNLSFYHYGKDRSADLRINVDSNCYYCHQNSSTAFTNAMLNPVVNKSIFNHTDNQVQYCYDCHGNGYIHDNTLVIDTLSNSKCRQCHSIGGIQATHNGTGAQAITGMNCWNCHQDPNTSKNPMYKAPMHGMMYPLSNGSYNRFSNNNMPANCTTCHVYNLVNTSTNKATIVPPLNHSADPYSGKKWGNYWDNASMKTACYYCHQNNVHKGQTATGSPSTTLLGNITNIKGSNQYKSSDLTKSRWCSSCHYNDSTSNYKGSVLTPVPPELLNKTGTVPGTANDGTSFYNHSGDVAAGSNDSKCKECHGSALLAYTETTLNFSHSASEGGGGPDCVSSGCHGTAGSDTSPYMNWTSLKSGMHAKLNNGADTTGMTDPIDAACWACHGDGTKPSGHPSNYKQPYNCTACHLASGNISGKYQAKNVTEHQHVDAQVLTNSTYARCENCHNNSLVSYSDNETSPTTILTNYTSGNVSHYGANKTAGKLMYNSSGNSEDCVYCHLNNSNRQKWSNATNATATKPDIHGSFNVSTSSSKCWECHVDSGVVTSGFTLHNSSLNPGASEFCLTCHAEGGSASNLNVTGTRMGAHLNLNNTPVNTLNNSDCWTCHFGYPNGVTGSHSYNVSSLNTYYCSDCHGPAKNNTAVIQNIDAKTIIVSEFLHASLDCAGCHAANDSRRPGGARVSVYHNSSAKLNATGVVSNPGWDMINGLYADCNDCHRIQNTRTGPFRGPGYLHYTTTAGNCGDNNCHAYDNNPHFQVYQPCYDFPACYLQPSVSPPSVSNLNLTSPVVNKTISTTTLLTAKAWDNYNIIENAKYRISNSSGIVVDWIQMDPSGGRWGPTRLEQIRATIDTSNPDISPGLYTVEVKAMAGGPRTKPGRYYPDNGEWSSIASIMLEVKQ
ncbi:MAG: carboxypeptidase regulatory-like domain-containing protein [Candidatus Methanoperedens sp.]